LGLIFIRPINVSVFLCLGLVFFQFSVLLILLRLLVPDEAPIHMNARPKQVKNYAN
jgi:hypothetical protein